MRDLKELESLRDWYTHLSLRVKTISIAAIVATVPLIIVGGVGVLQIRHQSSAAAHRSADAMSLSFSHAAELEMAVGDKVKLGRLVGNFMRDPDLMFVAAYDVKGKLITSAANNSYAWQEFQNGILNPDACIISRRTVAAAESGVEGEISQPLMGTIVIGLSTSAHSSFQGLQSFLMVAITALAAGAGGLILFLTAGRWMQRLHKLAEAAALIKAGTFTGEIHDHAQDEIGLLAQSLSQLVSDLRKRDQEVRRLTDALHGQEKQTSNERQPAAAATINMEQKSETDFTPEPARITIADEPIMTHSAPVDLDSLTKRCVNNRRLAAKALRIFDSGIDHDLEVLARSVHDRDPKAVAEQPIRSKAQQRTFPRKMSAAWLRSWKNWRAMTAWIRAKKPSKTCCSRSRLSGNFFRRRSNS